MASLPDHAPDASLWPEVPEGGGDKRRSKFIASRFIPVRRRILGDSDEVDLHSLRRSFLTACETAMHGGGRLNGELIALLVGHKRDGLAFNLYSDWSRLGRRQMSGGLAERLGTLRAAMEDVIALGFAEDVKRALETTADARPDVVRVAPLFTRMPAAASGSPSRSILRGR